MQARERRRVSMQRRWILFERDAHRRSIDAFEDEVATAHVEDRWRGVAVRVDVIDDVDLVLGDVAPPVASEHTVLIERVDVGVPSPSEDRTECRYAFTT